MTVDVETLKHFMHLHYFHLNVGLLYRAEQSLPVTIIKSLLSLSVWFLNKVKVTSVRTTATFCLISQNDQ